MFNWFSIVAGFLAAGLWLYAANIKVPTNIASGYGGTLVGVKEMAAGFKKQANWNSYGAVMTAAAADLTTSIPSMNFIPRMVFGNWLWPLRRCQLFSAVSASLKIMANAVLFERHPLERTVR